MHFFIDSVINGRAIRLSYSSARNWNKDDGNATSSDASARYNVIMEGPEIPNIKPPPPTLAMIAKTLSNNTTGAAALVDAYGNAYENPMFAYDPVFQVTTRRFDFCRLPCRRSSGRRCVASRWARKWT